MINSVDHSAIPCAVPCRGWFDAVCQQLGFLSSVGELGKLTCRSPNIAQKVVHTENSFIAHRKLFTYRFGRVKVEGLLFIFKLLLGR